MKRIARLSRPRPGRLAAAPDHGEAILEIAEVGGRGDGVAVGGQGPIYAPMALPGERVRARLVGDRAEILEWQAESAERQTPACKHFGACGGCQLQHWADAPYLAWKREQVVRALERRGIATEVGPAIAAWGEGRRRAAFHASRAGGRLVFGFIARGGARIEPISDCPVLAPALIAALPALERIARLFARDRGEITLSCLASDTGVDCDIKGASGADRSIREAVAAAGEAFARLSLNGEPLLAHRAPLLRVGSAVIAPPPGAFTQPTAAGEAALAAHVGAALTGARRIADLFCGMGTFALRLAAQSEVDAYDSEAEMLAALRAAADGAPGLKPIRTTRRDLLRTPLAALELKRCDAIVFDPPRAGARLQALEIAKSKAERVAAVSCDAATFARDARALIDGGFALHDVAVVDQFRWSAHVEIVGAFVR